MTDSLINHHPHFLSENTEDCWVPLVAIPETLTKNENKNDQTTVTNDDQATVTNVDDSGSANGEINGETNAEANGEKNAGANGETKAGANGETIAVKIYDLPRNVCGFSLKTVLAQDREEEKEEKKGKSSNSSLNSSLNSTPEDSPRETDGGCREMDGWVDE